MDASDRSEPLLPAALLVEVETRAALEQRPAREVLRDAVELYLRDHSPPADPARRTPREAAARMLERRRSHPLPDGSSIRDMMTDGRA